MDEFRETVQQLYNEYVEGVRNPRSIGNITAMIRNRTSEEFMNHLQSFPAEPWVVKVFMYLNRLDAIPMCEQCGDNAVRWKSFREGFDRTCSKKCSMLLMYGVENPMQRDDVKEKVRSTNIKKYGGPAPFSSKEVRDRAYSTYEKKTGYGHPSRHPDFMKNYQKKTGFSSPLANPDVHSMCLNSFKQRTGYDHPMHDPIIVKKAQVSRSKDPGIAIRGGKKRRMNFYTRQRELYRDRFEFLFEVEDYIGTHDRSCYARYQFRCKTCGQEFKDFFNGKIECTHCYPRGGRSQYEEEISLALESRGITVVRNNRTIISPQELDIYLPNAALAIEFDGLYWHSESQGKHRTYHLEKTERCADVGIRLIHVFEDEWLNRPEVVTSRICGILGVGHRTVGARKCDLVYLTKDEKQAFFNEFHLQGDCNSSWEYGLTHDGEIMCAMSFGRPRFNRSVPESLELLRFASRPWVSVAGGASRLLKRALSEHPCEQVISYADRRWSEGNLYKQLGFRHIHTTVPGYWYVPPGTAAREHRAKYQKHKLPQLIGESFDPELTERENMALAGFDRIWDCGNLVYVLENDK